MKDSPGRSGAVLPCVALDIGSTVVKVARVDEAGRLQSQKFHGRDFEAGIARQVATVLAESGIDPERENVYACSSANGGLRVGIVCLSKRFSGTALRNQVLLAGANPVFVHDFEEAHGDSRRVDLLLIGGGIDNDDATPMALRLQAFDPSAYQYSAMVYAGCAKLAADFASRFPAATVIANPQGSTLSDRVGSVFEVVRRAYLDDLVFKEGVSELPAVLSHRIRPTPEVASRGFLRSVLNRSTFAIVGPCLVLDIGGATTDVHYTVELVADDSAFKPASGVSVARYVFTDLGIVASRDTLTQQLRAHPQLFDFLGVVQRTDVRELYAGLRESEAVLTPRLLSYACLFLAIDRFARGNGPGLPTADLDRVSQLILTGGAAQTLDERVVGELMRLVMSPTAPAPLIQIDKRYEIWVAGITWTDEIEGARQ